MKKFLNTSSLSNADAFKTMGVVTFISLLSFCAVSFYAYFLRKSYYELSHKYDEKCRVDEQSGILLNKIDKLESVRKYISWFAEIFEFNDSDQSNCRFVKYISQLHKINTVSVIGSGFEPNQINLIVIREYFVELQKEALNFSKEVEQIGENNYRLPPYVKTWQNQYGREVRREYNKFYKLMGLSQYDFINGIQNGMPNQIVIFYDKKYQHITLAFLDDSISYLNALIDIRQQVKNSLNNGKGWAFEQAKGQINLEHLDEYTKRRVKSDPFDFMRKEERSDEYRFEIVQ